MLDTKKLVDSVVSKVFDSIYEGTVRRARERIDKIPFDAKELPTLFARLKTESETAQVLVFGSYLEDRIHYLVRSQLLYLTSNKVEEAIFGSNGPLSTFSSRLTLSYHLGWLSHGQKGKARRL